MESKDEISNIIRASEIIIEIDTFILKTKCYFFPMLLFIQYVFTHQKQLLLSNYILLM